MRKDITLILVFILAMAFVSENAWAANFDITGNTVQNIEFGKSATFKLNVKGNSRETTGVIALLDGDNLGWASANKYFFFLPYLSSKNIDIVIFPQENGSHRYTLTIESFDNHKIRDSVDILVNAIGPKKSILENGSEKVSIDSVEAKNTGNSIPVRVLLSKINHKKPITLDIYLKDSKGNTVSLFTKNVDGEGVIPVDHAFQIAGFMAGTYYIDAVVREFTLSKKASVIIPEEHNMVKKREVTNGFLFKRVSIVAENLGNTVEGEYYIEEKTPASEYVTWDVEPTSKDVSGNYIISTWKFLNLRPNDKIIVSYTIQYWFSVIKIIIAIILILAAIALVYIKLSSPTIKKKFIKKGDKEYLVVLEVKGSYFNSIKSVLVKDKLSPLMKLEEGKFEGVAPVVRKGNEATELLWRIGRMNRGDERILSYKIKGVVEAQIKMPHAMLRYKKSEDGEKLRVYSDIVYLE